MKKVLLVEDDPMLAEIYQKKFEKNNKFKVIRAASGTEALAKTKSEKPDLVLLDLVLPEMDGFDVLEGIKKDPNLASVKVVPFSNLSREDNRKKLDELKADGFIAKAEHTPQQLVDEVERLFAEFESSEKTFELGGDKRQLAEHGKSRILIIEDEEVFVDVFGGKLEESGYQVEKASNGKEGHDLLIKNKFGLVIVNMILPDTEAHKIISEFKASHPRAKTKFVILKDESDLKKEIERLEKLGVELFIDKDKVDPVQFVEKIKEVL